MTRTYELRTSRGARHMTFDTEEAARLRQKIMAGKVSLELVEVITTRQERVIAGAVQ